MLTELHIENFAIIERLDIDFVTGLITFTGETGAGKSIIIDAVETILGGRAEAVQVRAGAERASVEGHFRIPEASRSQIQAVLEREELLEPESAVKPGLPLQVGTKVRAVRSFGPVKKGAPGIITRLTDVPLFWWSRPAYLCTFADNLKVQARPKLIEAFDHGYKLEELEQPDFASILSRQMTLRAQQLFSRQRPTRLGNTLIRGA